MPNPTTDRAAASAASTSATPYAEAIEIAHALVKSITPFCEKVEVAGSIRRQRPTVKDIEICVIPKWEARIDPTDIFEERKLQTNILHADWSSLPSCRVQWIKAGTADIVPWHTKPEGKYWRGLLPEGLKLDLFIATETNWGAIYLIRTGSADFSKALVTYAQRVGYRFEDGQLWYGKQVIPVRDEAEVFHRLGLKYVKPIYRTGTDDIIPLGRK